MDPQLIDAKIIITETDDEGEDIIIATLQNPANGVQKWYKGDRSGTIVMSGFQSDCDQPPTCVKDDVNAHSISAYFSMVSPYLLLAREHGIKSVVVMISDDPLTDSEDRQMMHCGVSATLLAGVAEYIRARASSMLSFVHIPFDNGSDDEEIA